MCTGWGVTCSWLIVFVSDMAGNDRVIRREKTKENSDGGGGDKDLRVCFCENITYCENRECWLLPVLSHPADMHFLFE